MFSFCPSTTYYRGLPQTSLSESALQDTESSDMSKTVQTSKSIYDQPFSETSDFMQYLTRRVQIKTGFSTAHRKFVSQSQSESSLHTKDSSREIKPVRVSKSSYDEPSDLSRAAMRWIATRELLKTGFPETYTVKVQQSQSESSLRRKDTKLPKTVRASKSIHDAPSTDSLEFIQRLSKRANAKAGPPERLKEIKDYRPVCDLCSTSGRKEIKHGVANNALSEKPKKRERPVTPQSAEQLHQKRPKLETPSDEELTKQEIPCVPFVNACLKRELAHDKNTHHNLREIERLNAAPSTSCLQSLIQPNIITSTKPAWFENQFAEDDEDLDAEVAMIMDKGEPPTVCSYRLMPEYYVPRLVQERQIKELEGEPIMRLQDGSIQPFTQKWFRREPNKEAIKILDPWPCLHRNKIFGELEKIGSIQVEQSPTF